MSRRSAPGPLASQVSHWQIHWRLAGSRCDVPGPGSRLNGVNGVVLLTTFCDRPRCAGPEAPAGSADRRAAKAPSDVGKRDDQEHEPAPAYISAGLVAAWGIAHAIPARKVLAGFELIALAILTALTGTRTPAVWFKICPALLAAAAALLLITRFL